MDIRFQPNPDFGRRGADPNKIWVVADFLLFLKVAILRGISLGFPKSF